MDGIIEIQIHFEQCKVSSTTRVLNLETNKYNKSIWFLSQTKRLDRNQTINPNCDLFG